jgi:hypothetical protein
MGQGMIGRWEEAKSYSGRPQLEAWLYASPIRRYYLSVSQSSLSLSGSSEILSCGDQSVGLNGTAFHLIQLPLHNSFLVTHSLPLTVGESAINAKRDKRQNLKCKSEPLKHPMAAKVLPKPFGYLLFVCGIVTATIGMACVCLLLPQSENSWAFCGYIVCGIVFLWLTVIVIHRSLYIMCQEPSVSAPAHSDYRPVAIRHYATFVEGVAL